MRAGQYLDREPTNRAWADTSEVAGTGLNDIINPNTGGGIVKRNPVPQPNHHWGDGLEQDALSFANLSLPLGNGAVLYAFGGYSHRLGSRGGLRRFEARDRKRDTI